MASVGAFESEEMDVLDQVILEECVMNDVCTWLTHALQMHVQAPLVVHEWFVSVTMCFNPVAYLLSEFEMLRR